MSDMEKSASKFIKYNNSDIVNHDEFGEVLNGARVFANDYDAGKRTILRFIDGMLDGDVFDENGNLVAQQPAVETEGHLEFWRKNKLHRDGGEPAVYSDGFSKKEWWIDGVRQKDK